MEWIDIYYAFLWIGKQALWATSWFTFEQVAAVVLTALVVIAVMVYEPRKHRIVPWLNLYGDCSHATDQLPDIQRDVWRQMHIDPIILDPEYQRYLSEPAQENTTTQIRYELRPESIEAEHQIDELKRKKVEFMARKKEYIADTPEMEKEYRSKIDEYDKRINGLYHESKINNMLDAFNNPVLTTTNTTSTTSKRILQTRQFVPDDEYNKYIHSDLWKKRSRAYKEQLNGKCEKCGKYVGLKGLQVHHIEYVEDLRRDDNDSFWAGLCKECHGEFRRTTNNDKQKRRKEVK